MTRSIRKTAFTTIELLVVIGILVILAGMAFVGYKVVGTGGKTRSTKAALESARAMTAEIDAAGGMSNVKSIYTASPFGTSKIAFPPLSSGTPFPLPPPSDAGGTVISIDAYSSTHTIRYTDPAIVMTQQVMGRLLSSPVNRTIIAQLPGERLLKWQGGTTTPPTGGITFDTTTKQPTPSMLLDAWGNPMIFVPPSGLGPISVGGNNNQVQTSVGVRSAAGYTTFSPGATGFWASAGPDGRFDTGDDNVYSFE